MSKVRPVFAIATFPDAVPWFEAIDLFRMLYEVNRHISVYSSHGGQ